MRQKAMHRASRVAIAGTLALWLGGCAGSPEADPNAAAPVPVPAASIPADPAAVPAAPAVAVAAAPAGVPVPSPGAPAGTVPPELITSTNANERVQDVRRNRADPFSLIPVSPRVVQTPQTQTAPLVAPPGQGVRLPSRTSGSGQLAPIPTLVPNRSAVEAQRPFVAPPPARCSPSRAGIGRSANWQYSPCHCASAKRADQPLCAGRSTVV